MQISKIIIDSVEYDRRVNYARQQNDVPLIRSITLVNTGDSDALDVSLSIRTDPGFASEYRARIDQLAAGARYELKPVDVPLSPGYLSELGERLRGQILLQISVGGECRVEETLPIEILAYDEWAGVDSIPALIAAFAFPNHPAIERFVRSASDILQRTTGSGAIDGYQQHDRKRAWTIGASLYAAIVDAQIAYSNPPASFEEQGQKIRTPDRIESMRLGTCLDLALLFCACLEQAGLNPLIAFKQGHAFPGFWLRDESFDVAANDDLLALRKRVDLHDICVFESTLVTHPSPFGQAVREGRKHLDQDDAFRLFVDIRRARHDRIRPLPLRGVWGEPMAGNAAATAVPPPDASIIEVPDLPAWDEEQATATSESVAPQGRLEHWKAMLLDLTLRNRLLNFKESKKTLKLNVPEPGVLEDMVAAGKVFRISPHEYLMQQAAREATVHTARTGEDAVTAYLLDEMQAGRLHAAHDQQVLERCLLEIYRASKEAQNEGGANTLYLAIGFLSWIPQNRSRDSACLAPLVLVPVELNRKSVSHGFTLRGHDDETIVNISLIQLLERGYQLNLRVLETLPRDESGVDIPRIIDIVRRAVKEIPGWEVLERVHLGLFSFSKYLMWKDLQDHTELLLQNSVVDHLVNHPTEAFGASSDFPDVECLDKERQPKDTFCPLMADSSQLAAIFAASESKTFVMQGPPGTGKSQTIANIMAQCLTAGKTVLFVSEKAAALNVVYERLDNVGLAPFCLELHSNKARKRQVVEQLGRPLALARQQSVQEWEREAAKLGELRVSLNDYVEALHREHSNGLSLFKAIARLSALRDLPTVVLSWPSLDMVAGERLTMLLEFVDRLKTAAVVRADIADARLDAIGLTHWTPALDHQVATALEQAYQATVTLLERARVMAQRFKLADKGWPESMLEQMNSLAMLFLECPSPPATMVTHADWQEIEAKLENWIEHGRRRDALRQTLFAEYHEGLLELNATGLRTTWQQAKQSWFIKAWRLRRRVLKALRGVRRAAGKVAPANVDEILGQATRLGNEEASLAAQSDEARALLGRFWQPEESNWDELQVLQRWTAKLRGHALQIADADPARARELREAWSAMAAAGPEVLCPEGAVGRAMLAYRDAYHAFIESRRALEGVLAIDPAVFADAGPNDLDRLLDFYRVLKSHIPRLRDWSIWRRARAEALQNQLGSLIEAHESESLGEHDLASVFARSVYQWWFEMAIEQEPVVRDFFGPEHERKIERYREQDAAFTALTQSYVTAALAGKVPRPLRRPDGDTEIGILTRELRKRRDHLPIRQLVQAIPNILPRLAPCMLMSPISVAQYLPAGRAWFDVVIFDEASQMTAWDALGAIARGKSLVVAGDAKQMPPTNFFSRAVDDTDTVDAGDITDMESILDECTAAGIPSLQLKWHYRSRHESLIAFSNYQYYHNQLLTFPSPHMRGMGVSFRYVEGAVYDRGKSKTNRAEADAVVREIVARLSDPRRKDESIGVVTFNAQQQRLIEDLLETARQNHQQIERNFAEDATEPVFVKNLENVQGDERDVMLFSICYGKDAAGRCAMNFGPLNRDGGQRRLNVAITRARKALIVFSGIHHDDIDLNRSAATGVADLRTFLDYAKRGPEALYSRLQVNPGAETESPFEEQVKSALLNKGWQVHSQVGCSGYRLDLAVIDPRNPGRYLAGIECDGATYHSAHTARDRDRLRQLVLEGLGWDILRVWSTDWWHAPARETAKLHAALEALLERPESADEKPPAVEVIVGEATASTLPSGIGSENVTEADTTSLNEHPPREMCAGVVSAPDASLIYAPCVLYPRPNAQSEFYEDQVKPLLIAQIQEVVGHEGPIMLPVLARRLAEAWGFQQVTKKLIRYLRALISCSDVGTTRDGSTLILWGGEQSPEQYDQYRTPGSTAASKRKIEETPMLELSNALREVLRSYVSMLKPALLREAARVFGIQRLTAKPRQRLDDAVSLLIEKEQASCDDEGNIVSVS